MPTILSLVKPYNEKCVTTGDHRPQLVSGTFAAANLATNYPELIELAIEFMMENISQDEVNRLAKMTIDQARSEQWFNIEPKGSLLLGLGRLSTQTCINHISVSAE